MIIAMNIEEFASLKPCNFEYIIAHPLVFRVGDRLIADTELLQQEGVITSSNFSWFRDRVGFWERRGQRATRASLADREQYESHVCALQLTERSRRKAFAATVIPRPADPSDPQWLRRRRVSAAKSWTALAALVVVYDRVDVTPKDLRRLAGGKELPSAWQVERAPWYRSIRESVDAWIVPTGMDRDLYVIRQWDGISIRESTQKFSEVRALRRAAQEQYEARLDMVANALRNADVMAVVDCVSEGQEGGSVRLHDGSTVSLPGALRRAGISVAANERPIDAWHRSATPEFESPIRGRGSKARNKRLPAADRRAVAEVY